MKKIHSRIPEMESSYSSWHRFGSDHILHWVVFLLMTSVLSILIVSKAQESNFTNIQFLQVVSAQTAQLVSGDVSKLPVLTRDMLNLSKDIRRATGSEKIVLVEKLKIIAQSRHDLIVSAMKLNVNLVQLNAINNALRAQMPLEVRSLIEEKTTLRGKFEHLHIHFGDFETGTSEDQFYLVDEKTTKRFRIHTTGNPNALTDDLVEINGVVLGDQVATIDSDIKFISNNNQSVVPKKISLLQKIKDFFHLPVAQAVVAQKKVAVIMFNWQNDTRTPYTETDIRGKFFVNSTSANNYYKENSFGQTELVGALRPDGDVFGWVTIPYDNTGCDTVYQNWSKAAEDILIAQGVDLSVYNIKTYVFPSLTSCTWGGLGYVGGNPTRSWINGTNLSNSGTITHELGHNLGAQHASSWSCVENNVRVSVSSDANCTLGEYGDPYDVMGKSSTLNHLSNYHKGGTNASLNWLATNNIQTLDRYTAPDGVYTIYPIEQLASGVQSLRIPRTVSATGVISDYYYLESRKAVGFDQTISTYTTNGLLIRIAPNYNIITQSKLIDTTPETTSFADAPLAIGRTFHDPYNNIDVTLVAINSGVATVQVSFGSMPCVNTFPAVTIAPASQAGDPGTTLSYNVKVTNNDNINCVNSSYLVEPILPTGFLQSPTSFTTSAIIPGSSQTVTVNITSPDIASYGNFTFSENAKNTSNYNLATVSSAIFTVAVPDLPPTISIVKPANGSKVPAKGSLSISTTATDDKNVSKIEIFIDSKLIKTCTNTTSCAISYKTSLISSGNHTISAKATDASNHTTVASLTVTK